VIFGFTTLLFVINNLLLSILNGLKEIKTWVLINIIQSIYSLIFTTILIVYLGLDGALIALVTNQSVIFFIVIWMLRKHQVIKISNFIKEFDKSEAKKLGNFALMTVTGAVTVVSHLFLRTYIGENLSWDNAGYWQAIWYISSMYLMVVTTTLGIYYLPKLSEITDKSILRKELLEGYKIIMPIVILMSVMIFFLKDFIIWLLFTEDFTPIRELFLWQLVGDVIKIAAWLLAYLMLAKAMTRIFIITEIIFNLNFLLLSTYCLNKYGLVGITYSYAINYTIYFITMIYVTKNEWID
jgi:PST family polysaccharide transporter